MSKSILAQVYFISPEDYLAADALSPIRHEYVAGEVFAMAGATEEHATIAGNSLPCCAPRCAVVPVGSISPT